MSKFADIPEFNQNNDHAIECDELSKYVNKTNVQQPLDAGSIKECEYCKLLFENLEQLKDFYNIDDIHDTIQKIKQFDTNKLKLFGIDMCNMLMQHKSYYTIYNDPNKKVQKKSSFFSMGNILTKVSSDESLSTDSSDVSFNSVNLHIKINEYLLTKIIGNGSHGTVYLGIKNNTNFAVKKIIKVNKNINADNIIKKEIFIMKKLDHYNIVKLFDTIYDKQKDTIYIVMQYASKGKLFSIRNDFTCQKMDKLYVSKYGKQIISGLIYLHRNNVIHNDIKPENILLDDNDHILLSDFGVSELTDHHNTMIAKKGTFLYFAPEKFFNSFNLTGEAADIWAFGVTLFAMLYGYLPFIGKNYDDVKFNIINNDPKYPTDISSVEHDMFQKIFYKDAVKRITLRDLKNHKFFKPLITCDAPISRQKVDEFIDINNSSSIKDFSSSSSNNINVVFDSNDDIDKVFVECQK